MGNVSGRVEKSNEFDNVDYFMECGHDQAQVNSNNNSSSYPAHMHQPLRPHQDNYPENLERDDEPECPSSPISSYNNALFTLNDFSEKFPEFPPLLQKMPLNQPSSSKNYQSIFQKPLSANLNHLYIKRDSNNQPVVALSSSQRFRTKFVTSVLYKPFKKARK